MRGLAFVVIGGLSMATILTLIILPIFYLFFCKKDEGDRKPGKEKKEKDPKDKIAKKAARIRKKHGHVPPEDKPVKELTFVPI